MAVRNCAFTGHRPKSFPWKYDEAAHDCVLLKEILTAQIIALSGRGTTEFLTGMALGTDLWCAQIVLGLKEKNPALRLHCILPCEGQESKWAVLAQRQYHTILEQADEIVYVSREYSEGCMLKRNRYLVDHSSVILAVYNGQKQSGTAMTLRYAYSRGREIFLVNPISRTISHVGSSGKVR